MDVSEFLKKCESVVESHDFAGALACAADYVAHTDDYKTITKAQIREMIRRTATTAEEKLILENVSLMDATISNLIKRITVLLNIKPGAYVCSNSWGFGKVVKIDTFYSKVTIDFNGKQDHIMSLAVAGQSLVIADENHIMTRLLHDRDAVLDLAAKKPGDLMRLFLKSYGPTVVTKIEEILVDNGIIAKDAWKKFWEKVRQSAKSETSPIEIPTKRTMPVVLLESVEDYGDSWLKKFKACRVPKTIFDDVTTYITSHKGEALSADYAAAFSARLHFALLGTYKAEPSRYVQIMNLMEALGYSSEEEITEQCDYLLDEDDLTYLVAAKGLPARDIAQMVTFLLKYRPTSKEMLLTSLPSMSGVCLNAFLDVLKDDVDTGVVVAKHLTASESVPALLVWALRNRKTISENWKIPCLSELMIQAIHVIEQRLSGESLKMRNTLQAFFDSVKWLEEVCATLSAFERQIIFQRVQAAFGWETASQRNIINRMIKIDPELAKFKRQVAAAVIVEHHTSWRSLAEAQQALDQLTRVDLPKNAQDIATARSYGDLRENFEYHAAKDQQRQLLSRQSDLAQTLKRQKGTDFADATTGAVMAGTTVTFTVGSDTQTYTILGDLDRDEALNIISCKSRLALAVIGKKVGESAMIPTLKGDTLAEITKIELPNAAIKAWLDVRPASTQA